MNNPNVELITDLLKTLQKSHDAMQDKSKGNNREFYKRTITEKIKRVRQVLGEMVLEKEPRAEKLVSMIDEIKERHELVLKFGYKEQKTNIQKTSGLIQIAIDYCQSEPDYKPGMKTLTSTDLNKLLGGN
jgi:hypothetical protein